MTSYPDYPKDERDTKQQKLALRTNPVARRVRSKFPVGTRVEALIGEARMAGLQGTVKRHVPALNAQGGHLTVAWDNGATGRHSPGALHKLS